MKTENIAIGMTLELKPERAEAYGMNPTKGRTVLVTGLKPKGKHYKSVWVQSGNDFFRTSDFMHCVSPYSDNSRLLPYAVDIKAALKGNDHTFDGRGGHLANCPACIAESL